MFIYNTTIKIDWESHPKWLIWMKETYIGHLRSLDIFSDIRFLKILEQDETEGPTYALQLFVPSEGHLEQYLTLHFKNAEALQNAQWAGKMFSFSTLMEVVH